MSLTLKAFGIIFISVTVLKKRKLWPFNKWEAIQSQPLKSGKIPTSIREAKHG